MTLMTNVKKVSDVDQTIVQLHLDLMPTQIAVMMQKLELRIFAQLMNLVKWMKVTVIPITNAKAICFVDQTIVQIHLGFHLQLTAVNQKVIKHREVVRNLILGYPTLIHKFFGTFFGEIHRVNPEILGYPRIPRIHH